MLNSKTKKAYSFATNRDFVPGCYKISYEDKGISNGQVKIYS